MNRTPASIERRRDLANAASGFPERGRVVLSMFFEPNPKRVEQARRIATTLIKHAGVESEVVETVQLLVSEIVTNAIVHGEGDSVTFALTCDASNEVLIEVDDHTPGLPLVRDAGPDDESGRGMQLVTFFARDWGRTGTRTWCSVPVKAVSE